MDLTNHIRIKKAGAFYQAWLLTGPRQNFLALAVTQGPSARPPRIEALPRIGDSGHSPLDRDEVLRAVLAGVDEANRLLSAHFSVTEIRYVENDTPPESIYSLLARTLVEYIARGGEMVN